MGFDIYGRQPKNNKGEYFRNNVWWWRPLAEYVLDNIGVAIPDKQQDWFMNNGCKVSKLSSEKITKEINELIESGHAKKYEKKRKKELKELPLIECYICKGIGRRNDKIVQGKCNACQGTGKREQSIKNYPFSVENLIEFKEFVENSGGFTIC